MGRPLNKKYFGNRNIGTGGYQVDESNGGSANARNYADDRIGGEGVASAVFTPTPVVNSVFTSGAYLDKMPHITAIGAPTIPGGVQAVADVSNVQAVFAVPNVKGTGYQVGDIVQGTTGTGTKARFRVTAVRVITVTKTASGHDYDNDNFIYFDSAIDPKWTTALTLDVTSNNTGVLGNFTVTQYGVWTGSGAPTHVICTTANTRGGVDQNAAGAEFDLVWGIEAVEVVTGYQGDYTAVDNGAQAVTNISGSGSSATLDIFYGVKTITVTEKGSGYNGTETITFTAANVGQSETRAVGTVGLTTDTGAVGSATNQENAIVIHANVDGTTAVADIIRQVRTRGYKVKTAIDGVGICNLVDDSSPAVGEAYIQATDNNGNTYFVTKLTAHRATLQRWTNNESDWLFNNNDTAPWTFNSTGNGRVIIENA